MNGVDGLQTLKAIKAADLDYRVFILTVSDSEEDVVAVLRACAESYLLKDMEPEELFGRVLAAGQCQCVIADGLSNKLNAGRLKITEGTVKAHVRHVLKKLNLRARLEAAVRVLKRGSVRLARPQPLRSIWPRLGSEPA